MSVFMTQNRSSWVMMIVALGLLIPGLVEASARGGAGLDPGTLRETRGKNVANSYGPVSCDTTAGNPACAKAGNVCITCTSAKYQTPQVAGPNSPVTGFDPSDPAPGCGNPAAGVCNAALTCVIRTRNTQDCAQIVSPVTQR